MSLVKKYHSAGFSLIELITVIILLGILGVVALGRFSGGDVFAARGPATPSPRRESIDFAPFFFAVKNEAKMAILKRNS